MTDYGCYYAEGEFGLPKDQGKAFEFELWVLSFILLLMWWGTFCSLLRFIPKRELRRFSTCIKYLSAFTHLKRESRQKLFKLSIRPTLTNISKTTYTYMYPTVQET